MSCRPDREKDTHEGNAAQHPEYTRTSFAINSLWQDVYTGAHIPGGTFCIAEGVPRLQNELMLIFCIFIVKMSRNLPNSRQRTLDMPKYLSVITLTPSEMQKSKANRKIQMQA